ncbi:hypothetical protein IU500_27225 [Nocardia terpenica]|uniref:hypothetical protein n=1 Tax=Nocardia terpenica TaxID=455432 RepID=UPI0018945DF6|nr:hypothetical protein [Nocardia terpenica]MBF6064058.1 hypothetical protein [Nocardia terpenica]MBF6107706.1 hypothetical protein [Nocardia terpenica]MBF6114774.1 hypothetical protein [Nocardia terpenica]MBF6121239.1 hypothetical protein [Nocardia terpenica]MBF6153219.1 hypothetical protein [Nocardia terpenica]
MTPLSRIAVLVSASVTVMVGAGACGDSGTSGPTSASGPASGVRQSTSPRPLNRNDATVDARDYLSGSTYFFQSPSGKFKCGIYTDEPSLGAGCQGPAGPATTGATPDCGNQPAVKERAVKVTGSGTDFSCVNQGIYVGPPPNGGSGEGGGRVLPYGAVLVVQNYTCASRTTGVHCETAKHGFTVATQQTERY